MNKKEGSEEIAEETNLHTLPNQIPESVISDHHIKNSFINSPTKTRVPFNQTITHPLKINNFEKAYSANKESENLVVKIPNEIGSAIPKSTTSFFSKETKVMSNIFQELNYESYKDKKANSGINVIEINQKDVNPIMYQKICSNQLKPKFIVDDYSYTPEMLLSFQKIPCMPKLTPEIISKNAIILKERPNVLSDKTLIIDLDDTLVTEHPVLGEKEFVTVDKSSLRSFFLSEDDFSITNKVKFVIRPYVLDFLESLYKIYEIVVF